MRDYGKMKGRKLCELLIQQPQLADRCDLSRLDGLEGWNWRYLLKARPVFADRCDWEKLEGYDWCELLENRPEFADLCEWNKVNGTYLRAKRELLMKHPELIDRCAWELDGRGWAELFQKHPELVAKCPQAFRNFDEFTGSDWATFLQIPAVVNRLGVDVVEVVKATKRGTHPGDRGDGA